MRNDRDLRAPLRELALYLFFGVLTMLVSWGSYFVWREIWDMTAYDHSSLRYLLIANSGQGISFVLAVAFAFVTNKKYVFNSRSTAKDGLWRELWMFVSSRILSSLVFEFLLFNVFIALVGERLPSADLIGKFLMSVFVTLSNYVASKFMIFKKNGK